MLFALYSFSATGDGWNLGFWCEGQALTTITLSDFDTRQCAAFEIQRTAQVGEVLIPAGVEMLALPAAHRRLLEFAFIHLIFTIDSCLSAIDI